MSVSPVLGTITVPLHNPEPYKGLSFAGITARRQGQSVKAQREAAIDATYDAQDPDKLVEAIFRHVSRLYMKQSPYREAGSRYNSELASVVVAEVLRKLPWFAHEEPLTPYEPARSKFSQFINLVSRSRHLQLVEKHWLTQTKKRDREDELPEYENGSLADITVVGAISDDRRDALKEFLETLPTDQRALADEYLASPQVNPADRGRFRTILRKAVAYGAQSHPVGAPRPQRTRTWSMRCAALYRATAEHGAITTTAALFKVYGLASRGARPAGWQWEPTRDQRCADAWSTDGKNWTKATPTGDEYAQMMDPAFNN